MMGRTVKGKATKRSKLGKRQGLGGRKAQEARTSWRKRRNTGGVEVVARGRHVGRGSWGEAVMGVKCRGGGQAGAPALARRRQSYGLVHHADFLERGTLGEASGASLIIIMKIKPVLVRTDATRVH